MLGKIVLLFLLLAAGTGANATTLESRLDAAETRVSSVRSGPGGAGVEVHLAGTQPVTLQAADGAMGPDIQWAKHVSDAYELAIALGCKPLDQTLVTRSLGHSRSISLEGSLPITGSEPGQVLAQFFKALLRDAEGVPLDLYVAVNEAPPEWSAVLEAIRKTSVSTPSLMAGMQSQLSLPGVIKPGEELTKAHSPTPGISVDFVSFSGDTVDVIITADVAVPKGLHPVYFYGKDSRFEPAARIDLRIEPPPN